MTIKSKMTSTSLQSTIFSEVIIADGVLEISAH